MASTLREVLFLHPTNNSPFSEISMIPGSSFDEVCAGDPL